MMLKVFAVTVLIAAVSDAVWTALIAGVVGLLMEWMRRSNNAKVEETKKAVIAEVATVKQETAEIKQQTNGFLSKIDNQLQTALEDIKSLKSRLVDKDVVIADKDKVIQQVITGAAVLSGPEGKVGAHAEPLAGIRATVEDTNERVQGLEEDHPP